jgi:hypothetical protein
VGPVWVDLGRNYVDGANTIRPTFVDMTFMRPTSLKSTSNVCVVSLGSAAFAQSGYRYEYVICVCVGPVWVDLGRNYVDGAHTIPSNIC